MNRCRICSANDPETLVEDVAKAMWKTQTNDDTHTDWEPWEEASPFWQQRMRQFATATIRVILAEHAHIHL